MEEVPFTEMLADYYAGWERKYDMNFMGTNFVAAFDPYLNFQTGPDIAGSLKTSGLHDKS